MALARALAKDAPLVLLDEPLVNLDYKLREELRDELAELFDAGRSTVVYATTEPAEALLLGGHTAVLDAGELLQYGPTAEVFHRPCLHPRGPRVQRSADEPAAARGATAWASWLGDGLRVPRELPAVGADGAEVTAGLRAGALHVDERPGCVRCRARSSWPRYRVPTPSCIPRYGGGQTWWPS